MVRGWPGKLEKVWNCKMIPDLEKVWNFENVGAKSGKKVWILLPSVTTDHEHSYFKYLVFFSRSVIFEDSNILLYGLENGHDWPGKSMEKVWNLLTQNG